MKTEQDKWVADVFESMKGHQRASPNPKLFAKIAQNLELSKGKVIAMISWKQALTAAMLCVCLNAWAVYHINQNKQEVRISTENNVASNMTLISNFKIYE